MRYLLVVLILFVAGACSQKSNTSDTQHVENKKEVLIYCENSMVPVLMELKSKFEEEFNCEVKLQNDCSQNLASLIQYTMEGDIYLPASIKAFEKLKNSKKGNLIVDSVFLGYNPLVVMSRKGNPSKFNGDLRTLASKKHAVIIANPETSSLGAETKEMLQKRGLYNDVILNVVALSTDSRGLVKSLENDEAQLVINWASDYLNANNAQIVEIFKIPENDYKPTEIYGGLLSTSENKELAKEFLNYAAGDEGLLVFKKYGFNRRKSLIF